MSGANEWVMAIQEALQMRSDEVPDEWKTRKQLMSVFNLGVDGTCRKISMLKDNGLVEEKQFRVKTAHGVQPIPHYRLKK